MISLASDLASGLARPLTGSAAAGDPLAAAYIAREGISDITARRRIHASLSYLRSVSLLPDEAAFLRLGQQPSASAPKTLNDLTGVAHGTPALAAEGMNYESADAAHYWDIDAVTDFTLMTDVRGLITGQTVYGKFAHFTNRTTAYLLSGVSFGYHGPDWTSGSSCVVGFSQNPLYGVGANSNTDPIGEHQLCDGCSAYSVVAGYSWKNDATPEYEIIIDGRPELKATTHTTGSPVPQTTPMERLYIGTMRNNADWTSYHAKVTVGSWLLYRRILSDAEKLKVTRGMRLLDPRQICLATRGDSLTANVVQSPIVRSSWPIDFGGASSWSKYLRVFNYAQSGRTAEGSKEAPVQAKYSQVRPDGVLFSLGWMTIQFGTNDIQAGISAATCYGHIEDIAAASRAEGWKICILTCPQKLATWSGGAPWFASLAALNALIMANAGGAADVLVNCQEINQIEDRITGFFDDDVHFKAAANKIFSERVAAAIPFDGVTIPRCLVRPVISGTTTRTASPGTWENAPTGYAYQWYRDATAIAGATSAAYVLTGADTGHRLFCRVTATNASGESQSASSDSTPAIS